MLRNPWEEPHVFSTYFLLLHRKFKHPEPQSLFNMQGCEIITGHSRAHRQLFVIEVDFISACIFWYASPAFHLVLINVIPPPSFDSLIKFTSLFGCCISMITMWKACSSLHHMLYFSRSGFYYTKQFTCLMDVQSFVTTVLVTWGLSLVNFT